MALAAAPWADHAFRCWAWWRKGQLALLEPAPSSVLTEAIDTIEGASNRLERWMMDNPER